MKYLKAYLWIVAWVMFFLANCYAVKFAFEGMSYNSDFTFFVGLIGIVLLIVTDALFLVFVFKKRQPKGEEK
jgi:Na+-driven multidrug efflux pump